MYMYTILFRLTNIVYCVGLSQLFMCKKTEGGGGPIELRDSFIFIDSFTNSKIASPRPTPGMIPLLKLTPRVERPGCSRINHHSRYKFSFMAGKVKHNIG